VEDREPSKYSLADDATAVLGAVSAGAWISRSLRLVGQVPVMRLVPGHRNSRPETVAALFPGAQLSYHFPDSRYYLLFSSGWILTFNTGGDAGARVAEGPVFGGGAGYWLGPHVSVKAESTFSSVRTNLNEAKTTVKHLIVWASLCVSR